MTQAYSLDWFKTRALHSVRKTGEGMWDFSDSLLLYPPKGVEAYESMQEDGTPYNELVTKPEREYLEVIAPKLAELLPNNFEYIDLGPGTEHKEQFLFDALRELGKNFTYVPVDISEHFLKLSKEHAEAQGIRVRPMQVPFEELAECLGSPTTPRLVSIGLTFSNYEPAELFNLLSTIAGEGGSIFINAHIRDRTNMQKLREVYDVDARSIAMIKFDLLGLSDPADIQTSDAIEVWASMRNPGGLLSQKGVQVGDRMLIFRSLRYTSATLEETLRHYFKKYVMLDTGSPFIGALVWNE